MIVSPKRLNHRSRSVLRWMMIRVCALLLIWSFPWVLGRISFDQLSRLLSLAFTVTALQQTAG